MLPPPTRLPAPVRFPPPRSPAYHEQLARPAYHEQLASPAYHEQLTRPAALGRPAAPQLSQQAGNGRHAAAASGTIDRHASRFVRWRPDKAPRDCDFDQLSPPEEFSLDEILVTR